MLPSTNSPRVSPVLTYFGFDDIERDILIPIFISRGFEFVVASAGEGTPLPLLHLDRFSAVGVQSLKRLNAQLLLFVVRARIMHFPGTLAL